MSSTAIPSCSSSSLLTGDVAGSLEALLSILSDKQPQQLEVKVVHSGVGPITDSDIDTAHSLNGEYMSHDSSTSHVMSPQV